MEFTFQLAISVTCLHDACACCLYGRSGAGISVGRCKLAAPAIACLCSAASMESAEEITASCSQVPCRINSTKTYWTKDLDWLLQYFAADFETVLSECRSEWTFVATGQVDQIRSASGAGVEARSKTRRWNYRTGGFCRWREEQSSTGPTTSSRRKGSGSAALCATTCLQQVNQSQSTLIGQLSLRFVQQCPSGAWGRQSALIFSAALVDPRLPAYLLCLAARAFTNNKAFRSAFRRSDGRAGRRGRDRTCNPGLRRSVLYPIELLARARLTAVPAR